MLRRVERVEPGGRGGGHPGGDLPGRGVPPHCRLGRIHPASSRVPPSLPRLGCPV